MRDEIDGVDGATRPLSGRAHKHCRDGVGGPKIAVAPALRRGADASVPGTSRANVVPSRNAVSGASR